jgi:hypothetical protein
MTHSWLPICSTRISWEKDFEVLDLQHIPHAENAVADDLSAKPSTSALISDGVLERQLRQPTD